MPDAITTWIQALVRHRRALLEIDRGAEQSAEEAAAADPVLGALERRHERLARLRTIITDRARTSFVLVGIPERLVIEETARAAELLGDTGVDVGGLVVNRVLPDDLEGEFYQSRKAQERTYLAGDRPSLRASPARPRPAAAARRLRPARRSQLVSEQLTSVAGPLRLVPCALEGRIIGIVPGPAPADAGGKSPFWRQRCTSSCLSSSPFEHHDLALPSEDPRALHGVRLEPGQHQPSQQSPAPAIISLADAGSAVALLPGMKTALLAVRSTGRSPPATL